MSFRPEMIGITILNNLSGGTRAIYCPPTIYRPSNSDTSVCPPYSSLAGTGARCYPPRRDHHLLGLSPSCYFSGWGISHSMPLAYSSSPSYWRSSYWPRTYSYLSESSQGYYDPRAYGSLSKGVQRSYDPYGVEYLYSYRRSYCNPCDYGYSPSYGRRYCDPCVYNAPLHYGRSCYPSHGYTYRCGYSNGPCGYRCDPGYCQPCYADRRRYSSRPVSSDSYGSSSTSPYTSGCRRASADCSSYCGPC